MESSFADFDIFIPQGRVNGQVTTTCPKCSHTRKRKSDKCLSINIDEGVWNCHHCGESGSLKTGWKNDSQPLGPIEPVKKIPQQYYAEPKWNFGLHDAMISPEDIKTNQPGDFEIIWYYRNINGRLTAAKRMKYHWDGNEFKRDKNNHPLFLNTSDSGYKPCLYLEHDLTTYPTATVILVESEKTAALLRYKFKEHLNQYIFLATGGAQGLIDDKVPVLKKRKVLICYDCDQAEEGSKQVKGRDGAESAYQKLKSVCTAKIVDVDPALTDGTDLADILEQVDLAYLEGLENRVPEKIKILWDEAIVKVRPPARVPIISIQGKPLFTRGNHSLIIGKKKSRKSLFIVWLITEAIKQGGVTADQILSFDTEQDREDVFEMRDRVWRVTDQYAPFFSLRGKSYKERLDLITSTLNHWPSKPGLIIIDGIRDLMSNINDPDESTELMTTIERLTTSHNLHIIDVLHLNKTSGDPRGHIGTELLNKSELNIELTLDEKTNYTEVKCESTRRNSFNPFMFTHSAVGLPEIVGEKVGPDAVKDEEQRHNLTLIFEDGDLAYSDLIEHIKQYFKVGTNKAGHLMADFRKKGWLIKVGTGGTKDAKYHLLASNGKSHEPDYQLPLEEPAWLDFD